MIMFKLNKTAEVILVVCVFSFVVCCFSIPIIIYATSSNVTLSQDIGVEIYVDDCSQQPNSTSFESIYGDECSQYNGICSIHLNELTVNDEALTTLSNNVITEQQLSKFFSTLESFSAIVSEECLAAAMPFLCQYAYPPCDGNGSVQFITQEQCVNIRNNVCKTEWRIAMTIEQGNLLPVCETFGTDNKSSPVTIKNDTEPLICHYQFKEFCGVCLPLCGTFSQYPDQVRIGEKALLILAAISALIGGAVVLIAAVIRRSVMLVFPQVLVIYTILSAEVIALFIMISYIGGQETLYCSHETLHISIQEPTVFLQISGFVFHFYWVFMNVTWFLHLFHLFLGVVFPFQSAILNEKKWKNRLHVAEVFGSVILCSLAPTIYVSVSQYTFAKFPPLFGLPTPGEVIFYTIILPLSIILAVGVNITFYTFLSIHKSYGLFQRRKDYCIKFSVPEVKILIFLSYFIIFGIMTLVNFSVTVNQANPFLDDLFRYFACQLGGFDPMCEDIRRQFEKHLKPELNGANYFLFGLISWIYLLFTIQEQHIKKLVQIIRQCYHVSTRVSSRKTSSTTDKSIKSSAIPVDP